MFNFSRRDFLSHIGRTAGSAVALEAMAALGLAPKSSYAGAPNLAGAKPGTSVLILGAGLAGMVAAYELTKAGYNVQILEYSTRVGGRCWSLRGGDQFTELGGEEQICRFDPGNYFNPGPWRIPVYHYGVLDYCKKLGVSLQPFIQTNYNAYVHSSTAFDGKPQRYRHVQSDYQGYVAELLAKTVDQGSLNQQMSREDCDVLLESLKGWGALDAQYRYRENELTSARRGFDVWPGGGLMPEAVSSKPLEMQALFKSRFWKNIAVNFEVEHHMTMFQPVGGMDMIAKAFEREVGHLIQRQAKVVSIEQDNRGVSVQYQDMANGGVMARAQAEWCLCTIPASILGQMSIQVSSEMLSAIGALHYDSATKIGLQFKRRFWEEDEQIYGGISYTDLPIKLISYPSSDQWSSGSGVLLGGYCFGPESYMFTAMTPAERIKWALEHGALIHSQYKSEFQNGMAVSWHRVPTTLGCYAMWTPELRAKHYQNLCQVDGRIALAGEHASYLPAWQEGAVLSSLDAISRLHATVIKKASHATF